MIMIQSKFHNRWLIKMGQQGYEKRTQFIRSFRVMQYDSLYESSIMKFWTNHNYALFCWMKWKFHKTMHVSHKYYSFQICFEIDIQIVIFKIWRRRSHQTPKTLIWLNLKSNFLSNDMYIEHIASLEFEISKMF